MFQLLFVVIWFFTLFGYMAWDVANPDRKRYFRDQ